MRTSDVDILMVPGRLSSGPDHWQSRWERNLQTARRVEQADRIVPDKDAWVGAIVKAVAERSRPAVLVAHSLGVIAVVHTALKLPPDSVAGAFLVSASDVDNAQSWPSARDGTRPETGPERGLGRVPLAPLPFPSTLLAVR